ncbi:MAG TPA: energy transducer TonB [Blastocatellia bacterium]|nr:energy transducer TonB [Blastocatellia bacterium]
MFDRLVVSTSNRRRGRTARFFACTSLVYLSVAALAFAASVFLTTPKLADTSLRLPEIVFPLVRSGSLEPHSDHQPATAPTQDPSNVQKLDSIIENLGNAKSSIVASGPPGKTVVVGGPVGDGDISPGLPGIPVTGNVIGSGNGPFDPPKPPDPPKPQPKPVDTAKPVVVSSKVLQGRAIEKIVPVYPPLAKQIRMPGEVSVEVIISPEGRVESVRIVSGHPMFVSAARDAARGWRFEPTILNGVPVRVTGVITFVFKLNE